MAILDDYLTRDQLAAELSPAGEPISKRTIARYEAEADGLPSVMIGGRKLYRREAVRAWLAKRERQPNPRRAA